jgi:hypothetical protein
MRAPLALRMALAVIATCTSAMVIYALLRIAQAVVVPEPDPAHALPSEHAGYFWRAWTAVYVGGTFGFAAYLVAGKAPQRTARFLARAVVVAALLLAAQALLVP